MLGDKGNKSMIVLLEKMMLIEKISDTTENHRLNKSPIFLIKKPSKPIRPRRFGRTNTKN